MKIVSQEKHIPAQSYTITKYIASDGKEFDNQRSCENYERRLEIMKHPVIANRIEGLFTFDDEYNATLYYISSEEDYNFLTTYWISSANTTSDFYEYGPGWYLFYYIDGGDGPDFHHFLNYNQYEKEMEERWEKWKLSIRSKIKD